MIAPMELPAISLISMLSSRSALITPIWKNPRAPPPLRTSAIFLLAFFCFMYEEIFFSFYLYFFSSHFIYNFLVIFL